MVKALSKDKPGSVCVHVHVRVHLLVSAHRGGHSQTQRAFCIAV